MKNNEVKNKNSKSYFKYLLVKNSPWIVLAIVSFISLILFFTGHVGIDKSISAIVILLLTKLLSLMDDDIQESESECSYQIKHIK